MKQKQWKPVLALADSLIGTPGAEVAGWTLAGIGYHETKHYDQAVESFGRVLDLDPELKRDAPAPDALLESLRPRPDGLGTHRATRGTISSGRSRAAKTRA